MILELIKKSGKLYYFDYDAVSDCLNMHSTQNIIINLDLGFTQLKFF